MADEPTGEPAGEPADGGESARESAHESARRGDRGGGARTYEGAGIAVSFDARVCRHAAECVRGLPEVFDTGRRPWITPNAAAPEAVAEVVRRCPTGALRYRRADGGLEEPDRPTTVLRTADGRLLVRGDLRVTGTDGEVRDTPRAMLCGCGLSGGQPYCDRSGACRDT
ncbi:(4Fe-4S)-binding protein [Kitasatospora sp. NPDC059599]|uniref:(4Fe-4S)-binding protein n=1 Tax=Kitasatospora sp. NPDC059599 TaxID=3346880 RepID=UPI00369B4F7E